MKVRRSVFKAVAATMSILFVFTVFMPLTYGMDTKAKDRTVKGILEPHKGDLVLRDMTSGIRYHLAGQDLTSQRGKMVKVTGQITQDAEGDRTINVTKYETIKVR
ncbi:hypothetical protein [Desulfoferrobacter suflitae]|uniref:hypothetical protein n=1 Tax=Desulfoferrobacter suflitae TaxID=2865782 RepID=UPI00216494CB|nr:hypothetical protein [Desulfoferrobacter suflitae]MCK8604124.1 hypothetical protein [Desulfoferrobacter suflitae]